VRVCVCVPFSCFRTRYGAKAAGFMKKVNHSFVKCIFETLSCSFLCTNINISNKYRRMHTYIVRTPLY